ncbi:MAG TPA: amidohydrolase family protein [Candidatus Limnocylindria bacterium]|nr:amidohydrolase family protein [Candidatus Limnocylindria bacterium]
MARTLLIRDLAGPASTILVEDGRIAAIGEGDAAADEVIDAGGLTALPGFIELQVNGIGEHDFTSDPTSIAAGARLLAAHGVTSFLPTIVTSLRGTVETALDALAATEVTDGAIPIGLHVEGPFLSPARHGAHDADLLRAPDLDELRSWTALGTRLVTLAPELPGALEAVRLIADVGAVAALGHTDADAATTRAAIDAGARYATHLFNAMPPIGHRDPGAAGALLADERVTVGLIADGVHVDPAVLAIAARAAAGRLSVVSDGVASSLGHRELERTDDGARLTDGTLAGGSLGLDHGVRTMAGLIGADAAIEAVTRTPARLLGLTDGRGDFRHGGRADLAIVTPDLQVALTIVAGRIVHPAVIAAA